MSIIDIELSDLKGKYVKKKHRSINFKTDLFLKPWIKAESLIKLISTFSRKIRIIKIGKPILQEIKTYKTIDIKKEKKRVLKPLYPKLYGQKVILYRNRSYFSNSNVYKKNKNIFIIINKNSVYLSFWNNHYDQL